VSEDRDEVAREVGFSPSALPEGGGGGKFGGAKGEAEVRPEAEGRDDDAELDDAEVGVATGSGVLAGAGRLVGGRDTNSLKILLRTNTSAYAHGVFLLPPKLSVTASFSDIRVTWASLKHHQVSSIRIFVQ